jgi:serine/threonine protein kinase
MLLRFRDTLGQGSYGVVYRVEASGAFWAGKMLNLCDLDSIVREVVFLQYANHHGASIGIGGVYYCSNQKVVILMEECSPIPRGEILDAEIGKPIQSLHRIGLVHRDVSPRNVMRRFDGSLALVDYGMCSFFGSMSCRRRLSTCVTTVTTRAPEVPGGYYDETIDIWSAGVVCLWYRGCSFPKVDDGKQMADSALCHANDYPTVRPMLVDRVFPVGEAPQAPQAPQAPAAPQAPPEPGAVTSVCITLDPMVSSEHIHHEFGHHLFRAYKSVLPQIARHKTCIASQTDALATQVCDGDCRLVGTAAFAIVVLSHVRLPSMVDELASYAGIPKQSFREYVAHVLVSQRSWQWIQKCTRTNGESETP